MLARQLRSIRVPQGSYLVVLLGLSYLALVEYSMSCPQMNDDIITYNRCHQGAGFIKPFWCDFM